jgi:hypothetical protein
MTLPLLFDHAASPVDATETGCSTTLGVRERRLQRIQASFGEPFRGYVAEHIEKAKPAS